MRRVITNSVFIFAAFSMSGSASASSSDAWQVLYDTTAHACLKKSGLKKAKVIEGPLLFSNAILYKIRGVWPQAHMKGKTGKVLRMHPNAN